MKEAWIGGFEGATSIQTMHNKLATCQRSLVRWSGTKYGNAGKLIKEKTKELKAFQIHEDLGNWADITRLKRALEFLIEQEDVKWKQRVKQNWYRNGDRNTPFFHAWADHQRKINHIAA